MSLDTTNELLAAIGIAAQDAASRIQAATITSQNAAQAQRDVAATEANAQVEVATIDTNGRIQAASIGAQAEIQAAQIGTGFQVAVAEVEAAAREAVASIEAAAQTSSAGISAQAEVSAAQAHATATVSAADAQAGATISAATTDANARTAAATIQANAQTSSATIDANARTAAATTEADATKYRADQDLAGVNTHETAETYRLNLKLAFANDKWNSLLPIVNQALGIASTAATGIAGGGFGGGGLGFHASARPGPVMGFGAAATAGTADAGDQMGVYWRRTVDAATPLYMGSGDVKTGGIGFAAGSSVADAVAATQLPFISTSGVLTPAQIQQQVNASYARSDARVAGDVAKLTQDMSGQGFSANSPILAALRVGIQGQGLRASIAGEAQIRLDAAKANADAVFQAQVAVSDQFLKQEGVLIDNDRNGVTRTVGILTAISNLIGGAL
jgi:hypothetical protein